MRQESGRRCRACIKGCSVRGSIQSGLNSGTARAADPGCICSSGSSAKGGEQAYAAASFRLRHPADCIDDGSGRAGDALPCRHKGPVSGNRPQGHPTRQHGTTKAPARPCPDGPQLNCICRHRAGAQPEPAGIYHDVVVIGGLVIGSLASCRTLAPYSKEASSGRDQPPLRSPVPHHSCSGQFRLPPHPVASRGHQADHSSPCGSCHRVRAAPQTCCRAIRALQSTKLKMGEDLNARYGPQFWTILLRVSVHFRNRDNAMERRKILTELATEFPSRPIAQSLPNPPSL